jgi:glucose-1-phosphate adenylyltransferase
MDFLSENPPIRVNDPSWSIRTYKPQYPSAYLAGGNVKNSLIGAGCQIQGGTIRDSILSPGVSVEPGATVDQSIVFEGSLIKKGAKIKKSIIDKNAVIPENFQVGFDLEKDSVYFKISLGGIRAIPKGWRLE